jgi:hypothetical protein
VPPPLALHDIDNVAGFVGATVSRSGLDLSWSDREDLEQTLQIVAWELSLKYQPGGISFSTYADRTLRFRITDWQRSGSGGRTRWVFRNEDGSRRIHERTLPQFVPLDEDDGEPHSELGSTQRRGSLDDAERRLADGLRSLEARARRPPGRNNALD